MCRFLDSNVIVCVCLVLHGVHGFISTARFHRWSSSVLASQSLPSRAEVLSADPLVYVIADFLSKEECEDYVARVHQLEASDRIMTRSNPPEVSIDRAKLWPLPFLSLLAGIPPLMKMDLSTSPISIDELQRTLLPPIGFALFLSLVVAVGAVPVVLQLMSDMSSRRRTSDAIALNLEQDVTFVKPLVDRVENTTHHAWSKWEAPVVTRYAPGARFATHGDASPTKGSEWQDQGGQRVITCICYLNSVEQGGGQTAFNRLNIKVTPQQGKALFFFPANEKTLEADDRTIHESLPPMEEKWIVQMFGRVGPRVPPPLGLPDAYRSSVRKRGTKPNPY